MRQFNCSRLWTARASSDWVKFRLTAHLTQQELLATILISRDLLCLHANGSYEEKYIRVYT